jgi:hypothetical protein
MHNDMATIIERAWSAWVFVDICNEEQYDEAVAELEEAQSAVAQILREPGELWVVNGKAVLVIQPGVLLVDCKIFNLDDIESISQLCIALRLQGK